MSNTKKSPLPQLPEGCIAKIISLTSPKGACRAATVSLGFRSAADSDAVWEHFLPPNYGEIISRASPPPSFPSKKHLYFFFHDGSTLLLDGGKMRFNLNDSGEKSYMLSARALEIASSDNPQHWEWESSPESEFGEVAKLRSIERLEIRCVMPARMLSPNTKYAAWLIYTPCYGSSSGIDRPSTKSLIKFARGDGSELVGESIKIFLQFHTRDLMNTEGRKSWCFRDHWESIELGEFFIGEGADYDVHIQVSETDILNLKKGLIVEGIELMPSHVPAVPRLSVLRDWSAESSHLPSFT